MDERNLLEKTIEMIDGAYAPSTIRAYKGNFEKFILFCESESIQALPAQPATVAKFIKALTKSGLKSSSIRLAYASISTIHKLNELPDPTQSATAQLELRRMNRILGRHSKQALGINAAILIQMLESLEDDLRGLRNKALLMIAHDSLCRRSELVSLRIQDLEYNIAEGWGRVKLRKSKVDPYGIGRNIMLSGECIDALSKWINSAKISDGPILRGILPNGEVSNKIGAPQINRIFKAIAKKCGLANDQVERISGHSSRVGGAQELFKSGASLPTLLQKGGWSKPETALRYLENF